MTLTHIALTKTQWVWTIYALSLMQTVEFLDPTRPSTRKNLLWLRALEQDLVRMGLDTYQLKRRQAQKLCRLLVSLDCALAFEDEVMELLVFLSEALEGREPDMDPPRVGLN